MSLLRARGRRRTRPRFDVLGGHGQYGAYMDGHYYATVTRSDFHGGRRVSGARAWTIEYRAGGVEHAPSLQAAYRAIIHHEDDR